MLDTASYSNTAFIHLQAYVLPSPYSTLMEMRLGVRLMGGNTMYIMTYLGEEKEMQVKLERKKGRTRQNTNRNIMRPAFLHF